MARRNLRLGPQEVEKRTKIVFVGMKRPQGRRDLIAYWIEATLTPSDGISNAKCVAMNRGLPRKTTKPYWSCTVPRRCTELNSDEQNGLQPEKDILRVHDCESKHKTHRTQDPVMTQELGRASQAIHMH